jgi:hypothetical protein
MYKKGTNLSSTLLIIFQILYLSLYSTNNILKGTTIKSLICSQQFQQYFKSSTHKCTFTSKHKINK